MGEPANAAAGEVVAGQSHAAEQLRELQRNVIAYRRAVGNGRLVVVERQLMGQARICIGAERNEYYDDFWDYATVPEAVAEALLWDPRLTAEPARWIRHPKSGRRRPGGCESLEYIAP